MDEIDGLIENLTLQEQNLNNTLNNINKTYNNITEQLDSLETPAIQAAQDVKNSYYPHISIINDLLNEIYSGGIKDLSDSIPDAEKLHISASTTSSAITAARKANHITQLILKLKNSAERAEKDLSFIDDFINLMIEARHDAEWDEISAIISVEPMKRPFDVLHSTILIQLRYELQNKSLSAVKSYIKLLTYLDAKPDLFECFRVFIDNTFKQLEGRTDNTNTSEVLEEVIEVSINLVNDFNEYTKSLLGNDLFLELISLVYEHFSRISFPIIKNFMNIQTFEFADISSAYALLEETSQICFLSKDFQKRFLTHITDIVPSIESSFHVVYDSLSPKVISLIKSEFLNCNDTTDSTLSEIQKLLGHYVVLEHSYLENSLKLAINESDEIADLEADTISTIVDDIFYILQQCQNRSVYTGDVDAACALLNHVSNALAGQVLDALQDNFEYSINIARPYLSILQNIENFNTERMINNYFISNRNKEKQPSTISSKYSIKHSLNNISECFDYLFKFKTEIEQIFNGEFKGCKSLLRETTIQNLNTVKSNLESLMSNASETTASLFDVHLITGLDSLTNMNLQIAEDEYGSISQDDHFLLPLNMILETVFILFKSIFTQKIALLLSKALIKKLCVELEKNISSKSMTIYGAIHLDSGIRSIITLSSSHFDQSIKKEFIRISELCNILTVSSMDELDQMYHGVNTFSISISDAKTVCYIYNIVLKPKGRQVDYIISVPHTQSCRARHI